MFNSSKLWESLETLGLPRMSLVTFHCLQGVVRRDKVQAFTKTAAAVTACLFRVTDQIDHPQAQVRPLFLQMRSQKLLKKPN